MALILHQSFHAMANSIICVTRIKKTTAGTETIGASGSEFPRMAKAANAIVQLRMFDEAASTISQTDVDTFTLTGAKGAMVTVISEHNRPIVSKKV
jgi:hypothetical protein